MRTSTTTPSTIRLAVFTMESALETLKAMKQENPGFVKKLFEANNYAEAVDAIKAAVQVMPSFKIGADFLIEQHPGFHALQDASIKDVKKKLAHPNEYLGGPKGVATPTKIIRQADVVMLLALFENDYSRMVKNANLQYYEPRTERGTPLSGAFHAHHRRRARKSRVGRPLSAEERLCEPHLRRPPVRRQHLRRRHLSDRGRRGLSCDDDGLRGFRSKDGFTVCDARLPEAFKEASFKVVNFANVANITVKPWPVEKSPGKSSSDSNGTGKGAVFLLAAFSSGHRLTFHPIRTMIF
ncbi:MAG: hypothetical protein MZU97_13225 [Bacillus subtilis]|nr:hypothetical protein [Bacillus subtilis]